MRKRPEAEQNIFTECTDLTKCVINKWPSEIKSLRTAHPSAHASTVGTDQSIRHGCDNSAETSQYCCRYILSVVIRQSWTMTVTSKYIFFPSDFWNRPWVISQAGRGLCHCSLYTHYTLNYSQHVKVVVLVVVSGSEHISKSMIEWLTTNVSLYEYKEPFVMGLRLSTNRTSIA